MQNSATYPDYLVIGHVTRDFKNEGYTIGGTVTYSSLCAKALGKNPVVLTACAHDLSLDELKAIPTIVKPSQKSTTFENVETQNGRKQVLYSIATSIEVNDIPMEYLSTDIVHIGPVADEVAPSVINAFPNSFICLTPQGWMRERDEFNHVQLKPRISADKLLVRADATVISVEDVRNDESRIHDYANIAKVLAVTEGYNGARVYWNGDVRHFSAPNVDVNDPTGAGDIFATVFFCHLYYTKDPWESARRAVMIASASVSRIGIKGVPTSKEIRSFQIEINEGK